VSTLAGLANLCAHAGFGDIATTTIEVTVTFADFHEFWKSQTTLYSPTTKIIDAVDPGQRESLVTRLKSLARMQGNGAVCYSARANAVRTKR
jgi:hypothetical protein